MMAPEVILQNQKLFLLTIFLREVSELPTVLKQLNKGESTQKLTVSGYSIDFFYFRKIKYSYEIMTSQFQKLLQALPEIIQKLQHMNIKKNFVWSSQIIKLLYHLFDQPIQILMSLIASQSAQTLNVSNYKRVVRQLIQPHKEKINSAAQHFKAKIAEYRYASLPKASQHEITLVAGRRSPSLFSQVSADLEPQQIKQDKVISDGSKTKQHQLQEWQSSAKPAFPNFGNLSKYYQQLFHSKKCRRKNTRDYYDFKIDEKDMLTKIFDQIRTEQNAIQFQAVVGFFDQCKLFYLCYNIKPSRLLDILKDSAHEYSNKLTLLEFLNVFFIDRPNLTTLYDNDSIKVAKRCILHEESWKQLKQIFSTLDTFGNQTINMAPFLFKIKNNHSNRQLINQPTIEYPEISRTLPMKKIIFNLENRYKFTQKITWPKIQKIFKDFRYEAQPTIDIIYKRLIERGKITKFSNYFMISSEIIEEIKHIYNRCPKYCQYFIKTRFLCNELLESTKIKSVMKQVIVRIIRNGNKDYQTTLQEQIRLISNNAQNYIDLDELLEYFSIKGPINTKADMEVDFEETDSDAQEQRIQRIRHVKSADKINSKKKSGKQLKHVRHLTICQEFKLSSQQKQTTMERRARLWKQEKQREIQLQCLKKFKANPIPAQLNPQRYKQYLKQLQQTKILRHEQFSKKKEQQNQIYQYLKTNTNLFTVKQRLKTEIKEAYKFTPKSIPWHIVETNMLENINNQKLLRKKKILQQNKLKFIREWKHLPDVMQSYEDATENDSSHNQNDQGRANSTQNIDKESLYKKKIKEVPDFQRLHKQFDELLNKKKQEFSPTIPVAPSFTLLKKRQVQMETNKVSRVKSAQHYKYIQSSAQHKTSVQTCIAKKHIQIPTTKKYIGMVEFTQEKLQEKRQNKIREEQLQRERQNKQYNFAKFMQKKLKQTLNKTDSLAQITSTKVKNLKKSWNKLKKVNKQQMYQMYSRVMARPFLFENGSHEDVQPIQKVTKSTLAKPIWKKQAEGKHVHQSPLKYIDPEQDSPQKQAEKHQMDYEVSSGSEQSRNKAYLLNQSF